MSGLRKILSAAHARALIKEAIGIIEGDRAIAVEATAEIAAIEAAHGVETRATSPQMKRCRLHLRGAGDARPSHALGQRGGASIPT